MGKEEQSSHWEDLLEKISNEPHYHIDTDRKRLVDDRASGWATCAVGECLADIGIRNRQNHMAESDNTLRESGILFAKAVNAMWWDEAKHHLKTIRDYVQGHKAQLNEEFATHCREHGA